MPPTTAINPAIEASNHEAAKNPPTAHTMPITTERIRRVGRLRVSRWAVAPGMIERRNGRIVNVTSAAGVLGTIGQINYSAAKAGILGLTKSAARELAQYGITVNAVAPGAATPMTETIRTDPRFRDRYLDRIPMGRWAEPDEIAPVFVFFASGASSFVTGQVLAADGGMTIR